MYCFKSERLLLRRILLRFSKQCSRKIMFGILCLIFSKTQIYGQVQFKEDKHNFILNERWLNHLSVGFSINHTLLRGDAYGLSNIGVNKNLLILGQEHFDIGYGLRLAYQINPYLDLGLEYNHGSLSGVKELKTNRPYSIWGVDGNYSNINLNSRLYLSRIIRWTEQPKVLFYGDFAIGLTKSRGYIKNYMPTHTERILEFNSGFFTSLGMGLGFEFRLSKSVSLDFGTKLFYNNSDDLDGINKTIVSNSYNDAHWISHLGLNIDLSQPRDGYKTRKWNRFGLASEDYIKDDTWQDNLVVEEVYVVDTVYIEPNCPDCDLECEGLYSTSLFFTTSSKRVNTADKAKLNLALDYLKQYPKSIVLISGFADKHGRRNYNLTLSERRVNEIYAWFITHNIDGLRIRKNYYGEDALLFKEDSKNRRIDLNIIPFQAKHGID